MRLIRRMKAEANRIVIQKLPIPPVNLEKGEVAIKMERVLLTPLDFLLLQGYLDRKFLGTLGYGRVLEKTSSDIPEKASLYPDKCSNFPPIGREGVGSEIYPYHPRLLKNPPVNLKFPEMIFIYDLVVTEAELAEGQTLVIGGEGLQTLLLSVLLKDATLFGPEKRFKGLGNVPIISAENLAGSEWETIIVNTLNLSSTYYALKKTRWKNLIVNPFFACINEKVPISVNSFKATIAFPTEKLRNIRISYEDLEKLTAESPFIQEISLGELGELELKGYISVSFRDDGD